MYYRSRFATNPSGSGVPGPSQPVGRYPTYSRPVILCTGTKKVYLEVGTSKLGTQLQERQLRESAWQQPELYEYEYNGLYLYQESIPSL